MKKQKINKSGFTLIELVMVIAILGILAVMTMPRFFTISESAQISLLRGVSGGYAESIGTARAKLLAMGLKGPAEDVQIYGGGAEGYLDFNSYGWPSQHWMGGMEPDPSLDNVNDCMSVFETILMGNITVAVDLSKKFKAVYLGAGQCQYFLSANVNLSFFYNSRTGEVTIDDDPAP